MVGWELLRTATDWPLRQKLKKLGVPVVTDAAITAWTERGADVVDLRDGSTQRIDADTLVLATVNEPVSGLAEALTGSDLEVHAIGDCVAPRLAVMAIYEGRDLGQRL
jgi:NADH dehydrogenase FAD-containing subunit